MAMAFKAFVGLWTKPRGDVNLFPQAMFFELKLCCPTQKRSIIMKKTVEILFRLLSKDYEMDANTQEVCRYSLDIFLYTLVSTLGLLAIGAIL